MILLARNIGISVKKSTKSPINGEKNNPFNGSLSIRGKLFEGIVVNTKSKHTVTIEKKSFINFTLNENEQKLTEFVISSKADAGSVK